MAVKEIKDFMENGNIRNSVNYPACDLGPVTSEGRVAVCHKNIPNMLGQLTSILASEGVNISNMMNKSRGDYSYTLLDTDVAVSATAVEKITAVEGVLKVRVVK